MRKVWIDTEIIQYYRNFLNVYSEIKLILEPKRKFDSGNLKNNEPTGLVLSLVLCASPEDKEEENQFNNWTD